MLNVEWYKKYPANLVNDLLQFFTLKCTSEKCSSKLYQSHAYYVLRGRGHQRPNEYLCKECATQRRIEEIGIVYDLELLPQVKIIDVCEEYTHSQEMLT